MSADELNGVGGAGGGAGGGGAADADPDPEPEPETGEGASGGEVEVEVGSTMSSVGGRGQGRGAHKRRVKPPGVGAGLLDLGLDLAESSDDSDFRIEDHPDESDDCSIDSDDNGNQNDGENCDEEDSDDSAESSLIKNIGGNDPKVSLKKLTVNELLKNASINNNFKDIIPGLTDMLICAGCLGSRSDDANEIVECDGCGVTVHEGCYGVSDVTSESSTVSSASTEPWFCDACKAGVMNPTCELCPNTGGIFKETEVGAWVHLVCALYVPGVAFSEVDKLSGVTLFEMAYNRWGARACCLCEDERFSRTGICVGCDAGLCRTYFHVTCGQREGLLAEAHTEEVEQADPFYAHCKLHSDKMLIKKQKRNWLALQLRTNHRKIEIQNNADSASQIRTLRKLEKYRKKFILMKELKNAPWVPTQKMPRLLPTSATACRKLLQKAKMMGIDTVALEMQDAQLAALTDVRKKWHIPPAFSVEFIGYYLERNNRMDTMKHCLQKLIDANSELLSEQKELREEYEATSKESVESGREVVELKQNILKLHSCISAMCPTKVLPDVEAIAIASIPIQPPAGSRRQGFPTAAALKMGCGFPLHSNPEEHVGKVLSTSRQGENTISLNNECGICRLKTDQHLLAKCDTCHLYYHLGCLKPPLTRLPKKSKLYGWQCSECDKSSESEADVTERKIARRSRARYSKDGTIIPAANRSPSELNTEVKNDIKPVKLHAIKTKCDSMSTLKVTIKPVEPPPPPQDPLDVFSTLDHLMDIQAVDPIAINCESKPSKKEKKMRKTKKQNFGYASSSASDTPSKKSRKRSFTSPALTNTPLMSITPIVADSPHDSPSQLECSNMSVNIEQINTNQITSDTSFLSPNSTFSTLLANSTLSASNANNEEHNPLLMTQEEQQTYKSNRKRRKEKHRSRYSPDLMRSTKSHKHKRKKRSLSKECPDIPHPRITIKIKPIPKPDGSEDPQLFYVPTDSNDGPPPDLLKRQSSKHKHQEETITVFEPPPIIASPIKDDIVKPGSSTRKKKMSENRLSIEPAPTPSRRSGASNTTLNSSNTELTQCDVCSQAGTSVNLVRCDECAKRYHFTCLEPPLNKNPKKRGYSWHCADCDPTETDSS
ncbi:uncharacterized protein LOC143910558 isoform X2 [Arctopsyche grandis]|uniref:uncharacterized protein LOC143910558 isoform X2 n=1 Tax=Arctopsyche grandis TaxID=121162 RepID=UPI00406D7914